MRPNARNERGAPAQREPTVTELRLLLIGSGAFAVPSFAALADAAEMHVVEVVTAVPRAAGRDGAVADTPVAEWARSRGLPVREVARIGDAQTVADLEAADADAVVLADFGQIVPAGLLERLPRGIVNLHPSLLPRHRGASPVPAAILSGDATTGVTTIVMDAGVDSGPVLAVQPCPIDPSDTAVTLEARLAALAAESIAGTVRLWARGELAAVPQSTDGVTVTKRLRRDDGRIDAGTPCADAHRRWRAYQPWPGTWFEAPLGAGRVAIVECGAPRPGGGAAPGSLRLDADGELILQLPDGRLPLVQVRPAGGTTMSGRAFAHGRRSLLADHARIGA